MNLSGSSVEYSAQHYSPEEGWHGHTWLVTGQRCLRPFRDGEPCRKALLAALDRLTIEEDGHRRFPLPIWSNESIAEALVADLEIPKYVVRIDIARPGYSVEMWRAV